MEISSVGRLRLLEALGAWQEQAEGTVSTCDTQGCAGRDRAEGENSRVGSWGAWLSWGGAAHLKHPHGLLQNQFRHQLPPHN